MALLHADGKAGSEATAIFLKHNNRDGNVEKGFKVAEMLFMAHWGSKLLYAGLLGIAIAMGVLLYMKYKNNKDVVSRDEKILNRSGVMSIEDQRSIIQILSEVLKSPSIIDGGGPSSGIFPMSFGSHCSDVNTSMKYDNNKLIGVPVGVVSSGLTMTRSGGGEINISNNGVNTAVDSNCTFSGLNNYGKSHIIDSANTTHHTTTTATSSSSISTSPNPKTNVTTGSTNDINNNSSSGIHTTGVYRYLNNNNNKTVPHRARSYSTFIDHQPQNHHYPADNWTTFQRIMPVPDMNYFDSQNSNRLPHSSGPGNGGTAVVLGMGVGGCRPTSSSSGSTTTNNGNGTLFTRSKSCTHLYSNVQPPPPTTTSSSMVIKSSSDHGNDILNKHLTSSTSQPRNLHSISHHNNGTSNSTDLPSTTTTTTFYHSPSFPMPHPHGYVPRPMEPITTTGPTTGRSTTATAGNGGYHMWYHSGNSNNKFQKNSNNQNVRIVNSTPVRLGVNELLRTHPTTDIKTATTLSSASSTMDEESLWVSQLHQDWQASYLNSNTNNEINGRSTSDSGLLSGNDPSVLSAAGVVVANNGCSLNGGCKRVSKCDYRSHIAATSTVHKNLFQPIHQEIQNNNNSYRQQQRR